MKIKPLRTTTTTTATIYSYIFCNVLFKITLFTSLLTFFCSQLKHEINMLCV